jgi:hypothetical protein
MISVVKVLASEVAVWGASDTFTHVMVDPAGTVIFGG